MIYIVICLTILWTFIATVVVTVDHHRYHTCAFLIAPKMALTSLPSSSTSVVPLATGAPSPSHMLPLSDLASLCSSLVPPSSPPASRTPSAERIDGITTPAPPLTAQAPVRATVPTLWETPSLTRAWRRRETKWWFIWLRLR